MQDKPKSSRARCRPTGNPPSSWLSPLIRTPRLHHRIPLLPRPLLLLRSSSTPPPLLRRLPPRQRSNPLLKLLLILPPLSPPPPFPTSSPPTPNPPPDILHAPDIKSPQQPPSHHGENTRNIDRRDPERLVGFQPAVDLQRRVLVGGVVEAGDDGSSAEVEGATCQERGEGEEGGAG